MISLHSSKRAKNRIREAQSRYPPSLFPPREDALRDGSTHLPEEVLALVLEGLELEGTERVLELGSGTAYPAAVVSALAREVFSITASHALAQQREQELAALGCSNARAIQADLARGWPMGGPYQAIIVTASLASVPTALIDQLDTGGRLVAPIGNAEAQLLVRLHKRAVAVDSETLGVCHLGMVSGPRRVLSPFPWARQTAHETKE